MKLSNWLSSLTKINRRQQIIDRINSNPYYRFRSIEEIDIAAELGVKIDTNKASVDDWLKLPGMSITQARNLVEISNAGIDILCLDDLANALGISVLKIQSWQPILYFSYYDPHSFIAPAKLNLNQATFEQLITIPNLEVIMITEIIKDRTKNGYYNHIADLQKRLNLSQELTYHLMSYLQF